MTEQERMPDLRWQRVTCSRCGRTYQCTPFDDFHDPREEFGWTKGGVCYECLIDLYRAFAVRQKALPLRDRTETVAREKMIRAQIRRHG